MIFVVFSLKKAFSSILPLCAMSVQDAGDHCSPQLPMPYSSWQCLFTVFSHYLFCHPFIQVSSVGYSLLSPIIHDITMSWDFSLNVSELST